jgi:hypothetical protein
VPAIALMVSVSAQHAEAAQLTVTVSCPTHSCSASLIQTAIDSAATGSTIGIGAGTYHGDVTVSNNVTLQGDGGIVIINGGNSAGDPGATIAVPSGVVATIDGLGITGGYAIGYPWGGGIQNFGNLTLQNSAVAGNHAGGDTEAGGGIYNGGTLSVIGTIITGNTAPFGGGIANYATMTMSNTTVTFNSATHNGGGLDNDYGASATISDSTFAGNTAGGYGGAVDNDTATLTLANSTLVLNKASTDGGGIYSWVGTTPPGVVQLNGNTIQLNIPDNCGGSASC